MRSSYNTIDSTPIFEGEEVWAFFEIVLLTILFSTSIVRVRANPG